MPTHYWITSSAVANSVAYIDDLTSSCFLDLPQRHQRGRHPVSVSCVDLRPLRWAARITRHVHHAAKGLGQGIISGAPQVLVPAELAVGMTRTMTILGLIANASSLFSPARSMVPGADDAIYTSEIFQSAISSSVPRVCLTFSPIDSLFFATSASSQPCSLGPRVRSGAVCRN
jgi:hypothetical protein